MNQGHLKLVATNGGFTFNPSFSIYLFSRPAFSHFFHICRRLCLYPNGINKSEGKGHVSLYLEISDSENLPLGWEVTVNFKFFVFNHIHENYLTVQGSLFFCFVFSATHVLQLCGQDRRYTNDMHSSTYLDADSKASHFNVIKTRCGIAQFLSLDELKDPCNGYLMDDCCIFGAELFVIKYSGKGECLSVIKDPADGTFTWPENIIFKMHIHVYCYFFFFHNGDENLHFNLL